MLHNQWISSKSSIKWLFVLNSFFSHDMGKNGKSAKNIAGSFAQLPSIDETFFKPNGSKCFFCRSVTIWIKKNNSRCDQTNTYKKSHFRPAGNFPFFLAITCKETSVMLDKSTKMRRKILARSPVIFSFVKLSSADRICN